MMLQLIPVTQLSDQEDDLQMIYFNSFPADERRDWNQLKDIICQPHFNLCKIIYNQDLAGLIAFWQWTEFSFIEHFAIKESMQGKGLGTEVLNLLIREKCTNIILEAEEPTTLSAIRRIEFYKRLGFHSSTQEYYQPPYSPEKNAVKMLLLSYPAILNYTEFISIKAKIYQEVYRRDISDFQSY